MAFFAWTLPSDPAPSLVIAHMIDPQVLDCCSNAEVPGVFHWSSDHRDTSLQGGRLWWFAQALKAVFVIVLALRILQLLPL